jgi:hypothetical protein
MSEENQESNLENRISAKIEKIIESIPELGQKEIIIRGQQDFIQKGYQPTDSINTSSPPPGTPPVIDSGDNSQE